jgi:hypothetical protein
MCVYVERAVGGGGQDQRVLKINGHSHEQDGRSGIKRERAQSGERNVTKWCFGGT